MLTKEDNDIICRVGPDTAGGRLMRQYWIPAALSSELPAPDGPPLRVRLLGEDLVAFRDSSGNVGLLSAYCPHRRAPLFFGRNEEHGLRCVYHGWKFDVQGNCVDMPNHEASDRDLVRVKQPGYPVIERGHIIWAYMGPEVEPPPFPKFQFSELPEDQISVTKVYWETNWLQGLEGVMDPSHAPFLHSAAPQNSKTEAISALRTERIADSFWETTGWSYDVRDLGYGMLLAASRKADEERNYWRMNVFLLPFYAMGPVRSGDDPVANVNARVPVDDEHHFVYTITWHPLRPLTESEVAFNPGVYGVEMGYAQADPSKPGSQWLLKANRRNDYMINRDDQRTKTFTGIPAVGSQDQAVCEGMGSIADRTQEHLVKADLGISIARRVFLRAAKALRDDDTIPPGVVDSEGYMVRAPSKYLPRCKVNWVEDLREYYTCRPGVNPPLP